MLRPLLLGYVLLLFLYQGLRLGFLFLNAEAFQDLSDSTLLLSFIHGLRFDLAAIALSQIPIILILFLYQVLPYSWLLIANRILFTMIHGFLIGINIFDLEYHQFTGRRLTLSSFSLKTDLVHQFSQIAIYYWYYSVLIVFMILTLYQLARLTLRETTDKSWSWAKLSAVIAVIILHVLAARGGWQNKPLIPAHAVIGSRPASGLLTLNSSFTFLKSFGFDDIQKISFYPDWPSVEKILDPVVGRHPLNTKPLPPNQNVILIVMESFNREYMGFQNPYSGFTPFLDQLAAQSHFFQNHFANGRRSIDAIPAILGSIPAWMEKPFITSPYQTNRIKGLPHLLKEAGYDTSFFHGGYPGTMFFNVMAQILGFHRYVDSDDYRDKRDYDGTWGVFDEPFLQFVAHKLDEGPKPFFATVFTLSSHHPYTIPERYQGRFPQGSLEIHESIGYADYALAQFFKTIASYSWYEDTLFIITADHTSKSDQPLYQTPLGAFRVPLIFFHPKHKLPLISGDHVAQHIDIRPTVLDLLGIESKHSGFQGQSLIQSATDDRLVLIYEGNLFLGHTNRWLLRYDLSQRELKFFDRQDEKMEQPLAIEPPIAAIWRNRIEAYIQSYYNGLIEDRLVWQTSF